MASVWPATLFMRESYNTPERVYALAKARGMDLVAITDHDAIEGALQLAHHPDVIVGCEISANFPGTNIDAHIGVLDITPAHFEQIQRLRGDIAQLLPYLRQERIFSTLHHVASQVNGRLTPTHIAAILPWVDALEVINGSRLRRQNDTALRLAAAAGKGHTGGGDSHTGRGIGRTWTVVDGARSREEFLTGLRAGHGRAEGGHGSVFTMASDVLRFTGRFYQENTVRRLPAGAPTGHPAAVTTAMILGLPLLGVSLVGTVGHFVAEVLHNRALLSKLVATPLLQPDHHAVELA